MIFYKIIPIILYIMNISRHTILLLLKLSVVVAEIIFITSCTPQPSTSYDIKQNIDLNELEKTTLEGKKKKYHIYKLPYLTETTYASSLELSVTLDSIENSEFRDKGYFAVIVNAGGNKENISHYIKKYTHDSLYPVHKEPFSIEKKVSSSSHVHAQKTQETPEDTYNKLCASTPDKDTQSCDYTRPSKRSFFFNTQDSKKIEKILYKKIDFPHKGKHLYFALWSDGDDTEKLKLDTLELTPGKFENLYKKLYAINDNHIWGYHNFEDYAVGDSIIHIVLENLKHHTQDNIILRGFVDTRSFYYNVKAPNYTPVPEENTAPTIYINTNSKKNFSFAHNRIAFQNTILSTITHELQHVFTYYQKVMQQSSSIYALTDGVDTWIDETLSVAMQYLINSENLKSKKPKTSIQEVNSCEWYENNNEVLRKASLTNNENFTAASYKIAYMLVSYLIQNYGLEIITKALKNTHRNSYTLVQAAKDTAKYWKIPEHLRPKTIEDILIQFFTSIFTSDLVQNLDDTSHNYKFFTENNRTRKTKPIECNELKKKSNAEINLTEINEEISIISTNIIAPERIISRDNIIFEAKKAIGNRNPSYDIQHGKYGVAYLGGRLSEKEDSKEGVFKVNNAGFPYFTINLKRGSVASLVIVEYL